MCIEFIYALHSIDIVYVISGGLDYTYQPPLTYEVIGVNIATGEVIEPQDIIHAVISPAAASSINRLVVCGGMQTNGFAKHCQLYSPKDDRYVQFTICKYSSVPSAFCDYQ